MAEFAFTDEQIERYSRNIILSEVGGEGQKKLGASSVMVVGAGGLGCPSLLYLAAAGVGRLGVADGDVVDVSNLQRQIAHGTADIGRNKALSAEEAIHSLNPECEVAKFSQRLNIENIRDVVKDYDLVLDGSDNFPTRFLVADCCWFERIPMVSAAVLRFEGQLMTVLPGEGNPCYRCFVPEPPPPGMVPSCQEAGVLGAVVGVMGTLQAVETLKLILGVGKPLTHHLLVYEGLDCRFIKAKRGPDPDCPLCGPKPTLTDLVEYDVSCQIKPPPGKEPNREDQTPGT